MMKTLSKPILAGLVCVGLSLALVRAAERAETARERLVPDSEMIMLKAEADVYKIDRSVAAEQYRRLFSPTGIEANSAVVFFAEKRAYEILALALPNLRETDTTYGAAVNTLLSKKAFDKKVFDPLITQFDKLVAEPVQSGNEIESARFFLRQRIGRLIAKWLNLPEPKDAEWLDAAKLQAYSTKAKQKAALALVDSPF